MRIGDKIRSARDVLRLTQEDVVAQLRRLGIDLDQSSFSRLESDSRRMRVEELAALATVLERPVEYFLSASSGEELASVSYRSDSEGGREVVRAELWLRRHLSAYVALKELIGEEHDVTYAPVETHGNMVQSGNRAAQEQRRILGMDHDPIPDLRFVLEESVGVPVFSRSIDDPDFWGILLLSNADAAILVNSIGPAGRRNFTLAHEWGHLVWKLSRGDHTSAVDYRGADSREEKLFVNAFAAQVLVPDAAVQARLATMPEFDSGGFAEWVQRQANEFGVSFETMSYRLQNVGALTEEQADSLRAGTRVTSLGSYRGQLAPFPELSQSYQHLVFRAFGEGEIGPARAAELLGTNQVQFMEHLDADYVRGIG